MKQEKEYLCGGAGDVKKLKLPEINNSDAATKNLGKFFESIKIFLVSMKTKTSKKETEESVIKDLDQKHFRPRMHSGYEKFLVKVFELLNNRVSGTLSERLVKVHGECSGYCRSGKDADRKEKVEKLSKVFSDVLNIVKEEDKIRKFKIFSNDADIQNKDSTWEKDEVVKAIFEDGVKEMPANAFNGAKNLIKISFGKHIGNTTKCEPNNKSSCKIGAGAFKNCPNLKEIAFFPMEDNSEEQVKAAFDEPVVKRIEIMRSDYKQKSEKAGEKHRSSVFHPIVIF